MGRGDGGGDAMVGCGDGRAVQTAGGGPSEGVLLSRGIAQGTGGGPSRGASPTGGADAVATMTTGEWSEREPRAGARSWRPNWYERTPVATRRSVMLSYLQRWNLRWQVSQLWQRQQFRIP